MHIEKEVSEENYVWKFQNKSKFVLLPKRVNRDNQQVWNPEQLYLQFSSSAGCVFSLQAFFVLEEQQDRKVLLNVKNEKAIGKLFREKVQLKMHEFGFSQEGLELAHEQLLKCKRRIQRKELLRKP